jgi:anaphase-promoting complex subunit 8
MLGALSIPIGQMVRESTTHWLNELRNLSDRASEMLDSLVAIDGNDTDPDSPMDISEDPLAATNPFLRQHDPTESTLERQEAHKYLLAKSYFDTREYDRCAAVFLPPTISPVPLSSVSPNPKSRASLTPQKGKSKASPLPGTKTGPTSAKNPYPRLSQRSLFLALYAKYLAGEKRKDEDTEMVLGPADGGMTVNRELRDLARGLEGWFAERRERGLEGRGQGWLEYLYAVILLKGKNEEEAKKWLVRSVHLYPFHWGAWQELNDLLPNIEDVSQDTQSWVCDSCLQVTAETCG